MSFICSVYVPEAIVMASDSRQSVGITKKNEKGREGAPIPIASSDAVNKTFLLEDQSVGISFAGETMLGRVTTESHIKRFLEEKVVKSDDVATIADKILSYFKKSFPKANTTIHVCGFKKEGRTSVPYVFTIHVGRNEKERKNAKPKKGLIYGVVWSGAADVVARLLTAPLPRKDKPGVVIPKVPVLYGGMTPQDAVDFAIYLIRTTIQTMRFQARPKTVGGPIDVLLLTPEGGRWIQRKKIHGEG